MPGLSAKFPIITVILEFLKKLYFIVLRLNNMADVKQFNRRKIKLLPKTSMDTAISLIYNAEKKLLDEYNDKD